MKASLSVDQKGSLRRPSHENSRIGNLELEEQEL